MSDTLLVLLDGSNYAWRDGEWVQVQPPTSPPQEGMITISDVRVSTPADAPVLSPSETEEEEPKSVPFKEHATDVEAAYREGWRDYAKVLGYGTVGEAQSWEASDAKKKLEGMK